MHITVAVALFQGIIFVLYGLILLTRKKFDEVNKATLCHNDFGPRNILVKEIDGRYYLKTIIDFEQSVPIDIDKELIQIYLPLIEKDKVLAEHFKSGYEEFGSINLSKLSLKRDFYNLHMGLGICAWAKEVDYDYYLEGIKILEETMNRFISVK